MALLALVIVGVVCLKKRSQENKTRESVDLNTEYGAEQYYEYQETNVVDDNEMYRADNYADYSDYAAYDED